MNINPEDRKKALELAAAHINKEWGANSIMKFGDKPQVTWPAISTSAYNLDVALGIGGLPRGRVVEIYGPESSGKSTLAMHVVAEAQKAGGIAAYVDAEHAMDPIYARQLGVDVDELLISQPDTGEEALNIVDTLINSGALDVIVVDSVAALTPRAELEGQIGDNHVGLLPRLMAQALRKITGAAAKTETTVIFINQIREKIGVMFGNPETTPGGRALKFYSSVRLDVRKVELIKDKTGKNESPGVRTRVKVVKNKMAPPFRQAEFDILYGRGINSLGIVLDMGVDNGILRKSGGWVYYGEDQLGNGRDAVLEALASDLDMVSEIKDKIKEAVS